MKEITHRRKFFITRDLHTPLLRQSKSIQVKESTIFNKRWETNSITVERKQTKIVKNQLNGIYNQGYTTQHKHLAKQNKYEKISISFTDILYILRLVTHTDILNCFITSSIQDSLIIHFLGFTYTYSRIISSKN